jgi:hypothetical protein
MEIPERHAVRAVVLDNAERLLLFHTRDLTNPALLPEFLSGTPIEEPFENWS